jgi:hypothetical protein
MPLLRQLPLLLALLRQPVWSGFPCPAEARSARPGGNLAGSSAVADGGRPGLGVLQVSRSDPRRLMDEARLDSFRKRRECGEDERDGKKMSFRPLPKPRPKPRRPHR